MHYDTNIFSKEANVWRAGMGMLRSGVNKLRGAKPPVAPGVVAPPPLPVASPPWPMAPPAAPRAGGLGGLGRSPAGASPTPVAPAAPAAPAVVPSTPAAAAAPAAPAASGIGKKIMGGAMFALPTVAMTVGPSIEAVQAATGLRDAQSGFVEGASTTAAQLLHELDKMPWTARLGLLTMGSKAIDSPTGQKFIADYVGKMQDPRAKTMAPLVVQGAQDKLRMLREGKPMSTPAFLERGGLMDEARAYIERALDEQRKTFQQMGAQGRMVGPPAPAPAA